MRLFPTRRSSDKGSKMVAVLTVMLTGLVSSLTYILCFVSIPVDSKEPLLIMLGVVTAVWKDSMSYWWQSTKSSEDKTKMLANSVPANQRRDEDESN